MLNTTLFDERPAGPPLAPLALTRERGATRTTTFFVRLPTGRTQKVEVYGCAQNMTVGDLLAELPADTLFSQVGLAAHGQQLRLADLLGERGIKALDTVHVTVPLQGGAPKGDDGEEQDNDDDGKGYGKGFTRARTGFFAVGGGKQADIGPIIVLKKADDGDAEAEPLNIPLTEELTLEAFMNQVVEFTQQDPRKVDFSFTLLRIGADQNEELRLPKQQTDFMIEMFRKLENYEELNKTGQFQVTVNFLQNKEATPEEIYFQKIDVFNSRASMEILKLLSQEQKDQLKMFQSGNPSFKTSEQAQEAAAKEGEGQESKGCYIDDASIRLWLKQLDQSAKELLLYTIAKKNVDLVLEFLLKKAKEWTDIAQASLRKTNVMVKRRMMNRLFNQLAPLNFDEKSQEDEIIVNLIRDEADLFKQLQSQMRSVELLGLLMSVIDKATLTQVVEKLIENAPNKVSSFWDNLEKAQRLSIWDDLTEEQRCQLLFTERETLTLHQSRRLWDNMGKARRVSHWHKMASLELKSSMLLKMSNYQQVTIWVSVSKREQLKIFKMLQDSSGEDVLSFWKVMSLKSRSSLVEQLSECDDADRARGRESYMTSLTKILDMKDRSVLVGLLKEDRARALINTLPQDEIDKFFFYQNFNLDMTTETTSEDFVENIYEKFYARNNQGIPFNKMEDGYVQCIPNPQVKNGFITVQLVESQYKTENTEVKHGHRSGNDDDFYELETDEASKVRANKKTKNDEFRFCEHSYGLLREEKPNEARNSPTLGIISFWLLSEERGYHCYHSFYVNNPIPFKTQAESNHVSKNVIYVGRNKDVFFFQEKLQVTMRGHVKLTDRELNLQVIQCDIKQRIGEIGRESSENCESFRIKEDSDLYAFIMNGNQAMVDSDNVYFLNVLPTIIRHGNKEDNCRFVVFSKCSEYDAGPSTYFYDMMAGCEVLRVRGAEAFIDYYSDPSDLRAPGSLLFLSNKHLLESWDWSVDRIDPEAAGKAFAGKLCSKTAYKEGSFLSIAANLGQLNAQQFKEDNDKTAKAQDAIRVSSSNLDTGAPSIEKLDLLIDEVLGTSGLEKWRTRYLRDAPIHIAPFRRNEATGYAESFTILAENNFSFSFSMTESQAMLEKKLKELKEAAKKAEEAAAAAAAEAGGKEAGGKGGKGGDDAEAEAAEEVAPAAQNSAATMFRPQLSNKGMLYKAVYMVPDAQYIIKTPIWPQQVNKKHWGVKQEAQQLFVQTSLREEGNINTDAMADEVKYNVRLYNCSEDVCNAFTRTNTPEPIMHEISVAKEAIQSYMKNNYGGKQGRGMIRASVMPLVEIEKGQMHGAVLFMSDLIKISRNRLHWFRPDQNDTEEPAVLFPQSQTLAFDYPIMAYKGFAPDNRELVITNLAEDSAPQKLIHLSDLQFISFVGHNYSDREARIGFLALAQGEVVLCWIHCNEPFQKRDINDYEGFWIQQTPIKFNLPILDEPNAIKKVEFVRRGPNQDETGLLFVQTEYCIYWSNNYTGQYDRLTTRGRMVPCLLQRGFNSIFYYVERGSSGDDQIVYELKADIVKGNWKCDPNQIFKINEGQILALELDPENNGECDSIYTNDRQLKETREEVLNRLYIVDDQENLSMLEQNEAGYGSKYTIVETRSLSNLPRIQNEIAEYKRKRFSSMSITKRCLTLNEINYNFANGHSWELSVKTSDLTSVEMIEKDEEDSEEVVCSDDESTAGGQDEEDGEKLLYQVHSVMSMPRSFRQVITVTIQQKNDSDGGYVSRELVITKALPGNRRKDVLGMKGMRDIESINMISDDLFLMKFRSSGFSGKKDYWTVVSRAGQIQEIPHQCRDFLLWSTFSNGASRLTEHGCVLSLKGGQKNVLSFWTDAMLEEKRIIAIEFNRGGQVMKAKAYDSSDYERSLKEHLSKDLIGNQDNLTPATHRFDEQSAAACVATLKFADNIICSRDGELYRVATVHHKEFNEEVIINTDYYDDNADCMQEDELWAGLYTVSNQENKNGGQNILRVEGDDLRVIVLLCKNSRTSNAVRNAGFVICGDYLCYQYPDMPIVNILQLSQLSSKNSAGDDDDEEEMATDELSNTMMSEAHDDEYFLQKMDISPVPSSTLVDPSTSKSSWKKQRKLLQVEDSELVSPTPIAAKPNNSSKIDSDEQVAVTIKPQRSILSLFGAADQNSDDRFVRADTVDIAKILQSQEDNGDTMSNQSRTSPRGFVSFGKFVLFDTNKKLDNIRQCSNIEWRKRKTRTINLQVMMGNPDSDMKNTHLSDVPSSTQLSVQWLDRNGAKISKPNSSSCKAKLNTNLLQIAVTNQIIVFDLSEEIPQERFFFNCTQQFMDPEKFVESGILMAHNYEDPSKRRDGHLFNQVIANRDRSQFLWRQDRILYEEDKAMDQTTLKKTSPCKAIFRHYCEADINELNRINRILVSKKRLDNIDLQSAICIYDSHTIFSIFNDHDKMMEQILTQLDEGEWEPEVLEDESEIQNGVLRRLFRILNLPTPLMQIKQDKIDPTFTHQQTTLTQTQLNTQEEINESLDNSGLNDSKFAAQSPLNEQVENESAKDEEASTGITSVLYRSLKHESSRVKDCLMSIANKCDECQLSTFARNLDDMNLLLSNVSPNFIELVDDSFIQTPFTRKIVSTDWYSEASMVTFRRNSSLLTEEACEDLITRRLVEDFGVTDEALGKQQVNVTMLNIDWMLADSGNFVDYVRILKGTSSEKIYQLDYIYVLLNEFWDENFRKIFWKILLPWAVFMLCNTWFFMTILVDGYDDGADFGDMLYKYILSGTIIISLFYQIWIEIIESSGTPFIEYITSPTNYLDIFTYSATVLIIICSLLESSWPDMMAMRLISAFVILAMWIKVFDWLRLFEKTSFYIKLITETFADIGYFFIIFLIALSAIGCAMYMLQLNQADGAGDIVEAVFGHFFLDSIYNQYMMSLGEFTMDGFGDHPEMIICYVFFLAATFVTQLTFLNMLIAIMGDTFGRVIENKNQYGLQTKLSIMGDYTAVINRNKVADKSRQDHYLFVVKPRSDGTGEDGAWEGGLGLIKKSVDRSLNNLESKLVKEISKLQTQGMEAKVRDSGLEKEINRTYAKLSLRFSEFDMSSQETENKIMKKVQMSQNKTVKEFKNLNEAQQAQQKEIMQRLTQMKNEQEKLEKQQLAGKQAGQDHLAKIVAKLDSMDVPAQAKADASDPVPEAARESAQNESAVTEKVERLSSDVADLSSKLGDLLAGIGSLKESQNSALEAQYTQLKQQMEENEQRFAAEQAARLEGVATTEQIQGLIGQMGDQLKAALLEQQQQQQQTEGEPADE